MSKFSLNKPYIISLIILLTVITWMLSGMFKSDYTNTFEDSKFIQEKEITVLSKQIKSTYKTQYIKLNGKTESEHEVDVSSEINAKVIDILVKKGDIVKKDDVLCQLAIDVETRALMAQKELEYTAAKKLFEKGYKSQNHLAAVKTSYDTALALIEKTKITSPFAGIVDDIQSDIGDFMAVGGICATVIDQDPIIVVSEVPEKHIEKIKQDITAKIKLINGNTYTGKIKYLQKSANENTRTFKLELEIDNTKGEISSGVTTEVKIPIAKIETHKINSSLLTLDDGGNVGIKIIDKESHVQFVEIDIIEESIDGIWVYGLPNEVRIITVGHEFVVPGQKVIFVEETSVN